MTREVGSMVGLPVSYGVEVDSGDYDANMRTVWMPVFEDYVSFTPSETGQRNTWVDIRTQLAAQTNYHPNVTYMCMFKGIINTAYGEAKYYYFTIPEQYLFLDTDENAWRFFWLPQTGSEWAAKVFTLDTGENMEITEIWFVPCIPIVMGAGFDDLDTDSDEGDTVIGKIKYNPIPRFSDTGSCKLYDYPDILSGNRIYGKAGITTDNSLSEGVVAQNGLIRVEISLAKHGSMYGSIRVGFNRFGVYDEYNFTFQINSDEDVNVPYHLYIVKNTPEMIHLRIFAQNDIHVDIKMKRGIAGIEVESDTVVEPSTVSGLEDALSFIPLYLDFAWCKDALLTESDGCHSRQTSSSPYELDPVNPTNHYIFLFRRYF